MAVVRSQRIKNANDKQQNAVQNSQLTSKYDPMTGLKCCPGNDWKV